MTLRKAFFWLHLIAGCVAGAIILLMSVTGVLLMYERQIVAWADRGPLLAEPAPGAQRLGPEELLAAVRQQRGGLPANAMLTIRSDPREPAEIGAGREGSLYLSVHTGQVLGKGAENTREFFRRVTAWHRWLGVEGPNRAEARAITGASNLLFLVLVASGAYLWIPRQWSRRSIRPIAWFRRGNSGRARDFNWHNVFGLWSLVPLFFVVLTALPMSYPWANDLLYRLTGSKPPAATGAGKGGFAGGGSTSMRPPSAGKVERDRRGSNNLVEPAGLNRLWARAAEQVPGWNSIAARIPASAGEPVSFIIDTGNGGQPQKRSTLTLDRASAAVLRWETFAQNDAGRRLRLWSRFVHTGDAFGFAGQTAAGVASAAGVMLVWTGISLALRRLAAWKVRVRAGKSGRGLPSPSASLLSNNE